MQVVSESLQAKLQGAFRIGANSVCFRVWAPNHQSVKLVLDGRVLEMPADGDGFFTLELSNIAAGTRYSYRLGDAPQELPDPASRWQPDGVHRPSAVFFPEEFTWHDDGWQGLSRSNLAIYELHVGSFTPEGTFAAIIPRLPQLKELGVTALEIMPVSQFPGARNWGYDGVHPYATQNSYGGPQGLMQLVDAAHQAGLGVMLDVVYNHFGPEGNYLSLFGPYFHDRYHTPWGAAVNYDGPDSDPVRFFAIENACQWIRDFHIDGLRLDAVQTIFDQSAYPLIAELQQEVQKTAQACGRPAIVIAETDQNDVRITADAEQNGYGLDGVWSDDFHHCVHTLLTGERDGYYIDFSSPPEQLAKVYCEAFVYDGVFSTLARRRRGSRVTGQPRERFVICIQNHDQVGNRPRGDRLGTLVPPAAQRLAAALMLLAPDTPLLFMGEEYGETNPFPFFCSFGDPGLIDAVREGRKREFSELAFKWQGEIPDATAASTFEQARLSWDWESDPHRTGLRRLYQALLAARKTWPPLTDRSNCTASVLNDGVIQIERGVQLLAIVNLTADATSVPSVVFANRHLILSTDEKRFGGIRERLNSIAELSAFELVIWGDARWI